MRVAPAVLAAMVAAGAVTVGSAQHAGDHPPGSTPGMVRTPGQRPAERAPAVAAAYPPRLATARAFDEAVRVEVRGLPTAQADAALRAAVEEIREVEDLVDPAGPGDGAGLAAILAAGGSERAVDPRLADLLARSLSFCRWSLGAHGPLGGRLYRLWEEAARGRARPTPEALRQAVESAGCDGLEAEATAATARLVADGRLDLRGFARGFAVDRAVEVLRGRGVVNGLVEVGWVRRAFGGGVDGSGWPVLLPVFPGETRPADRLSLRDRAVAVVSTVHRPLVVAGDPVAPWLDQRDGSPAEGLVGVAAATELAVDAEALAVALAVLGNREGTLRLISLRPAPAVLWLLGDGGGAPLVSHHHWSELSVR